MGVYFLGVTSLTVRRATSSPNRRMPQWCHLYLTWARSPQEVIQFSAWLMLWVSCGSIQTNSRTNTLVESSLRAVVSTHPCYQAIFLPAHRSAISTFPRL